ncbi:MAG: tripartite tricarboxylate transporter substrate binding protein [Acidovorax soli]|uniref:tripartite tricarboxylate transporter substrate binding protein n=1 Tax=Acidovorax soli TaxID=592050 RepID=UPI0026F2F75B|nr:tripartite tricarboxylate transporter substrate binding protein [Acidovorax soli]MCM2348285.1 tripartite tricarboxylate transporter substrate binding protein [Acidovorax soli]
MNDLSRRHFLQYTSAAAALAGLPAWAQDTFPTKPLSLVVPYPAGGPSDASARIFAESFTPSLKQQVIVENYGGGSGLIGANKVLSAPADGYTFLHGSPSEVVLPPMLNPAARYKPGDFVLAGHMTTVSIVLVVRNGIPASTMDEFLDYVRQQKGKPLTYASIGIDSLFNLMGDALAARLNLPFLHVPYKGSAPALQDLAGGQVDFAILAYQKSFEGMQEQGRLKIVSSFSKDMPPGLKHIAPITRSKQIPDFVHENGGGYFMRKGTPADRVAVLRKAIAEAVAKPEIRGRLEAEGRKVAHPTELQTQVQADAAFKEMTDSVASLLKVLGRTNLAI